MFAKLVTYCAKGAVRRSFKEAGFTPERIPGPPGKREMLRGTKEPVIPQNISSTQKEYKH
jgi:tRNA U34 5-methylaminomethyl-2-thiouridine-forming methyltransferase MnmC